jgi:CHAT domain-containing protein
MKRSIRRKTEAERNYLAFAPVFPNGLADSSKGAEFLAQNLANDSTFAITRASRYALLASATEVTSILHLGEVYNLNLNTDLVVLSACETGRGEIKKGEGIIGLTRDLLYAGASNLLVSLWQVDDEATAKLMVDFYDRMLNGVSKAEALHQAKLQMLQENPEQALPYYWSAFILIGR